MKKAVGILGFGYVAKAFADEMQKSGYLIKATSRSANNHGQSNHSNVQLHDFTEKNIDLIFSECPNILISTPPLKEGPNKGQDPFLSQFGRKLKTHHEKIRWLGYLSATSVYGDHQGRWVDESTTPQTLEPASSGQDRLDIEKAFLKNYEIMNLPVHIFRLAGIYGMGRNAIQRILNGKKHTIYEPQQFFSRIHVKDIANALVASIQNPTPGEIFNVCDDKPAPSYEVDEFAARLIGAPTLKRISLKDANLSQMGNAFYQSNKRVSNDKMKQRLGLQLTYPTYREGLRAIAKTLSK